MGWLNTNWKHRRRFRVPAANVAADLTDFPININMAHLPFDVFANTKLNFEDIRITKADGTTEVPFQITGVKRGVDLRATSGSWNSGADTVEVFPADTDAAIYFEAYSYDSSGGANTNFFMGGFTLASDAPAVSYTGIDFALYVRQGYLRVYESNVEVHNQTAFTDGDIVSVHRNGSTGGVDYRKNGVTFYTHAGGGTTAALKGDFAGTTSGDEAKNIILQIGSQYVTPTFNFAVNMDVLNPGRAGTIFFKASGTLSSSVDNDFYIYYGNSAASAYSASDTYGSQNVWSNGYAAVYHFNENPSGTIIDSTANGNDGTSVGSMDASDLVDGPIRKAVEFNGSSQYIDFGNDTSLQITNNLSVECWFNGAAGNQQGMLGKSSETTSNQSWLINSNGSPSGTSDIKISNTTGTSTSANSKVARGGSVVLDNTWHHLAFTFTTNSLSHYVDGVADSRSYVWNATVNALSNVTEPLKLGGDLEGSVSDYKAMKAAELRISNVVRSANWYSTQYANQNAPETFYSIGVAEHETSVDNWYNESWTSRIRYPIDVSKVNADLTNYPLYIDLSDLPAGFFTAVKSDGSDIRITLGDGLTEIPYELVSISTGGETGELHCKLPELNSVGEDAIYIYYENAAASAYAASATYGSQNVWSSEYEAVYHLNEAPTSATAVKDSTKNANHSTSIEGSMDASDLVDVKLGKGLRPDGVNDRILFPNINLTKAITAQAWVKAGSTSGAGIWFCHDDQGSERKWYMQFDRANNNFHVNVFNDSNTNKNYRLQGLTLTNLAMYHFGFENNVLDLYHNGAKGTPNIIFDNTVTTLNNVNEEVRMFSNSANNWSNSDLDEARIQNVKRADAWISTEYNNQNDAAAFFGTPVVENLDSPPTVDSFTPADNATDVAITADLVINFSENVTKGTGNIVIKRSSDDSTFETIDVTSGQVTIVDDVVTINPSSNFAINTEYYVQIASTCFEDSGSNTYAGISDTTSWSFTTVDPAGPVLESSTPADNATGVARNANIVLDFNENVFKGASGNVVIKKYSDDTTIESIAIGSAQITIVDDVVTINPSSDLPNATRVYLTIDNTCFKNAAEGLYDGISSKDTLDFTTEDTVAPTLSSSTPADGATGVARNADIVLTFDENVAKGTGNITIKNYDDDTDIEVIDVTSGQVTVSTTDVTINPSSDLPNATRVYVLIDGTAIEDSSGNAYAGIASKDTLDFTTEDDVAPTLSSSNPAPDLIGFVPDENLVLTFDENVAKGASGNVVIKKYSDDSTFESIAIGSAQITIVDNVVTINPSSDLAPNTKYYLEIDATVIKDASDNFYAGISDKDTLAFTTIPIAVTSLTPADGSADNAVDSDLEVEFNQNVSAGSGNVTIEQRPNLKIGGDDFAGDIAEILVVTGQMSDSDRQKLEGYLAWEKFGASNPLASDHPYKYRRPTV